MSTPPNDKPHFAVPEDDAVRVGETSDDAPVWGDDAKQIAKDAGLGSYGDSPGEVERFLGDVEDRLDYVEGRLVLVQVAAVRARVIGWLALFLVGAVIAYLGTR